jgi:hypothetical protein
MPADELDEALSYRGHAENPEVQALLRIAEEVASVLQSWRLSAADKARIRMSVEAIAGRSRLRVLRRVVAGRRAPAFIGGATAVAVAAALGIGVAVARGRRHQHALAT